jgi:hypothetical protein
VIWCWLDIGDSHPDTVVQTEDTAETHRTSANIRFSNPAAEI